MLNEIIEIFLSLSYIALQNINNDDDETRRTEIFRFELKGKIRINTLSFVNEDERSYTHRVGLEAKKRTGTPEMG